MDRRTILRGLAGGAGASLLRPVPAGAIMPVPPSGCRRLAFEAADYVVCRFDLRRFEVELFWSDPDGRPYGSLANLAGAPAGAGLVMAMNAGMYHADLKPVGLFVEAGREVTRINRADGPGNFHLKPNGVFFVGQDGAGILETGAFVKARPRADYATQSGPMLVIDGALHPKISDEGPSRKTRNGVGVRDPRTVVFAISREPVSFGAFARLFRDELGCRNALFLDGSVSALHAPELGLDDMSLKPLGPLVGVKPRALPPTR